jgi:DNA-binding GntR family transcriptional regulator
LAAERGDDEDFAALDAAIDREVRARTASDVHDASRDFHVLLAAAAHNRELVLTIESLWLVEVGRRLLARRSATPQWKACDVAEHREILAALRARDGARAAALTEEHVRAALRHWEPAAA